MAGVERQGNERRPMERQDRSGEAGSAEDRRGLQWQEWLGAARLAGTGGERNGGPERGRVIPRTNL